MSQPASNLDFEMLSELRTQFSQRLKDFASQSSSAFQILRTIPSTSPPIATSKLIVLDSSFNPPSRAHSSLVVDALSSQPAGTSRGMSSTDSQRVLLLLATVNADKKPKPADYADRLVMMTLMAEELRASPSAPVVDVGITSKPYFIDKAKAIDESGVYGTVEQTHLTGFDTLIRILSPKYYPPTHSLGVLAPFLTRHRIRATFRPSPSNTSGVPDFDTKEKEQEYVDAIRRGERETEGLRREWSQAIDLVEGIDIESVSSTAAREAVKEKRWQDLGTLVGRDVQAWIREKGLYID